VMSLCTFSECFSQVTSWVTYTGHWQSCVMSRTSWTISPTTSLAQTFCPISLSNVENDGRRMASTQYWQMVANTLPWFTGPQRHASSADELDPNVRHSQMYSREWLFFYWLTRILTEMLDIWVALQFSDVLQYEIILLSVLLTKTLNLQ